MTGQGMEDNPDAAAGREQIPAEKRDDRIFMEAGHGSRSLMFHFISHA